MAFRSTIALALTLFCSLAFVASACAADSKTPPLKVLFISGGGWHDYSKLTPFLTDKLPALANLTFDVKRGPDKEADLPDFIKDPKLGDGYDAIVYDICYHGTGDQKPEDYTNVLQLARDGKPSILLHCAMHCFRPAKPWTEFAGMRTHRHEKFGPFGVRAVDPSNPITLAWPQDWKTRGDELYVTDEVYPDTTPLLVATSPNEKDDKGEPKQDVVAWIHPYGKGRVFGTTLGHDLTTTADPAYLHLLANGILWACDKLDPTGKPAPGYGPAGK